MRMAAFRAALFLIASLAGLSLSAQPGGSSRLLLPPVLVEAQGDERSRAELFGAHLATILASEFAASGFVVDRVSDGPYDAPAARRAGCRWLVVSALSLRDGEATCSLFVRDVDRGLIVGAEDFAAWGGPTFITLLDALAHRIAARMAVARDRLAVARSAPLEAPTLFLSPDEGAWIRLASREPWHKEFGAKVDHGKAEIGPLPFPQGSLVEITWSKRGKLAGTMEARLGDGELMLLPALRDDPLLGLLFGLGSGHLPGMRLGASFHIPGGWFFLPVDDYLSATLPLEPGVATMLREEAWMGLGAYLFFPPSSRFRCGLESRLGLALSLPANGGLAFRLFVDPLAAPISVFGEFAIDAHLAARLEVGGAYAFGIGGASAMGTGWTKPGTPSLDLAVEWKP